MYWYFYCFDDDRPQLDEYSLQENIQVKSLMAMFMAVILQVNTDFMAYPKLKTKKSDTRNRNRNIQFWLETNMDYREQWASLVWGLTDLCNVLFTGIDTANTLLERMQKGRESDNQNQNFLLEPLLALTLTQTDAVSSLHKCDIPTQLYLSGKLGLPEPILWLDGPKLDEENGYDDDDEEETLAVKRGQKYSNPETEPYRQGSVLGTVNGRKWDYDSSGSTNLHAKVQATATWMELLVFRSPSEGYWVGSEQRAEVTEENQKPKWQIWLGFRSGVWEICCLCTFTEFSIKANWIWILLTPKYTMYV